MKQGLFRIAVMVLVVLLVFTLLIGPGLLAAPIALLIGWWSSLVRLCRVWHPNPHAVLMFALGVTVLVTGTHVFLRWLYACLRRDRESTLLLKWPWKWTLCGFAMLFCSMLAVCCVVLTTHQLYWISKSSDPLFTDPSREWFGTLRVAMTLRKDAEEAQWDSARTRASFWQRDFTRFGQPASEVIQPLWVEKDEHTLRGIILIPRRPLHRDKARLLILQPGANLVTYNLTELPRVLASFAVSTTNETSMTPTPSRR